MTRTKILFLFTVVIANFGFAQTNEVEQKDSVQNIEVDPFNHQSKLGQSIYVFFLDFERTGHFADGPGEYTSTKLTNKYIALFAEHAKVPNDINMKDTAVGKPISVNEYARHAKKHGYFHYRLILEKKIINATLVDSGRYKGTYRFFKLYSEKAVLGEAYQHGASFEMVFEFNVDGSDIRISGITQVAGGEYRKFRLGNFGYTSDFNLMASNNLKTLIKEPTALQIESLKPPKDSADYRAQPALVLFGGYVLPDYLTPSVYKENLNDNAPNSSKQTGYSIGARLELPLGKKGNLNLFFGLEYEKNKYEVKYNDLAFIYKTDVLGKPLEDLEGNPYDEKWVDVSKYFESGSLAFIKPEIGLVYKIKLGKKIRLNLLGGVGYSYLTKSDFKLDATVSYRGKIYGLGNPISSEELGFYTDYLKNNFGEITNATSFYYYKYGGSLDFRLSKHSFLSFGFEMRTGLSSVLSAGEEFYPFLDPAINDTFLSNYTNVPESRTYQSMMFNMSLKFEIRKK